MKDRTTILLLFVFIFILVLSGYNKKEERHTHEYIVPKELRQPGVDTIYYEGRIKIGTHKGDILTGESVKNVYNK